MPKTLEPGMIVRVLLPSGDPDEPPTEGFATLIEIKRDRVRVKDATEALLPAKRDPSGHWIPRRYIHPYQREE